MERRWGKTQKTRAQAARACSLDETEHDDMRLSKPGRRYRRRDPRDASLALRIGSAMVATHDFDGAVAYYEKATNANRSNGSLLIEFASLLARIGREKAAQQLLAPMR